MLDVSGALKNPGQAYPFRAEIDLPDMEVLDDPVHFDRVEVNGEFFCTGDHRISLRANAEAEVVSRCDRCLEPMRLVVTADIDALYARELDPSDPDLYSFEGRAIELTDAVRDAVLLELPLQFLCSDTCRGLCPVCGANLNRTTCTCQEGGNDTNPFSALKSIVLNSEEV